MPVKEATIPAGGAPGFACLFCGGELDRIEEGVWDTRFGVPDKFDIARCTRCGLEQTVPRPNRADLDRYYATYYNFGGSGEGRYARWRERFLLSRFYRFFLALDGDISFHRVHGSGRLIDIGCNEGRGLKLYRRNGFAAEGLEINPVARAAARQAGFVVHGQSIEDFAPARPYRVAVLSNVLEHALDPAAMLGHVARILEPGGEVWISCPNSRSFLRDWFAAKWLNWHVPFHISHFSPRTLLAVLERAGFAAAPIRTLTPALWIAQGVIAWLFARPGRPTGALRNPFLVLGLTALARGLLFPWIWLENRRGRGDCLALRARKG